MHALEAMRHTVPGFEQSKLRTFSMTLGTRDSINVVLRIFVGHTQDMTHSESCEDVVLLCVGSCASASATGAAVVHETLYELLQPAGTKGQRACSDRPLLSLRDLTDWSSLRVQRSTRTTSTPSRATSRATS